METGYRMIYIINNGIANILSDKLGFNLNMVLGINSPANKIKIVEGAGIMGFLDYPFEFAEAILGFLRDPEGYVGTEGRALERAMKEYLVPDFDSLVFEDKNVYID